MEDFVVVVVFYSVRQSPFRVGKCASFRELHNESLACSRGTHRLSGLNAQLCGGWGRRAPLPWRTGWESSALPGGRGFLKQLEPLFKGKCLIDIAAGLSDKFNSEGWSIDLRKEHTWGREAGRQQLSWVVSCAAGFYQGFLH